MFRLKFVTKLFIVFYDPIMNYSDLFPAVELRMGIGRSNTAMSSPADMPDTHISREFGYTALLLYLCQLSYIFLRVDLAVKNCSYTG